MVVYDTELMSQEFKRMMDGWKGSKEEKKEEKKEKKEEKKEKKEERRERRRRGHSRAGSDASADSLDLEQSALSSSSATAPASGKLAATASFKPAAAEAAVVKAPAPASSRDQAVPGSLPPPTAAGTGASSAAVAGGSSGAAAEKAVTGVSSPKAIRSVCLTSCTPCCCCLLYTCAPSMYWLRCHAGLHTLVSVEYCSVTVVLTLQWAVLDCWLSPVLVLLTPGSSYLWQCIASAVCLPGLFVPSHTSLRLLQDILWQLITLLGAGLHRTQQPTSSATVTSVMTPLLEKTDTMLASWFSRGSTSQVKSGGSPGKSRPEAPATGDKPELEANNSVTSAVVPILEKTDEYLASWGITRSHSNAKSEGEGVLQVSLTCS